MKRVLLLLLGALILYIGASGGGIALNDYRNRANPRERFVTDNPPPLLPGVVATAYDSVGMTCRTRKWTLAHSPEDLKKWLGSADFKLADQRLAGVRQKLDPSARPPFRDKKYIATYMRTGADRVGHFLLIMDGGRTSDYVVVDQPFRDGLMQLANGN